MAPAIEEFVEKIPVNILTRIFCHYTSASVGHLMRNTVIPLTEHNKRLAVEIFIKTFVEMPHDERGIEIRDIVARRDYFRFGRVMRDQFYFEPLYDVANRLPTRGPRAVSAAVTVDNHQHLDWC